MNIERLRALEIELRNEAEAKQLESQDKNWSEWVRDRAHGRSAGLHEAANRIQQLIAELGQEVGAVESVWMFRCAGSRDEWMPFVNEKHRLNTMRSPEWEVREFTSPAHTSEARDAKRYRWLRDNRRAAIPEFQSGWDLVTYRNGGEEESIISAQTLDDVIDAAMRQEAGEPCPKCNATVDAMQAKEAK